MCTRGSGKALEEPSHLAFDAGEGLIGWSEIEVIDRPVFDLVGPAWKSLLDQAPMFGSAQGHNQIGGLEILFLHLDRIAESLREPDATVCQALGGVRRYRSDVAYATFQSQTVLSSAEAASHFPVRLKRTS